MTSQPTDGRSYQRAWDSAMRLLTRRDHSVGELRAKLKQRRFSTADVDRVIERCIELDYLNDARSIEHMTRALRRRQFGVRRIVQQLLKQGYAEELVARATAPLENDVESEIELAARALAKRRRPLQRESDLFKRRAKAFRYLLGRGFSSETAAVVLPQMDDWAHAPTDAESGSEGALFQQKIKNARWHG